MYTISVLQRHICIPFQSHRGPFDVSFVNFVNFCPISKKGSGEIETLAEPLIRATERYRDRVIAAGQADRG